MRRRIVIATAVIWLTSWASLSVRGETPAETQSRAARTLGLPVYQTNSIGGELALIPAGEFLMGSTAEEIQRIIAADPGRRDDLYCSEGPRHRVRITRAFYVGRTCVTIGEFRQFVAATDYRTEAERDALGGYAMKGRKWQRDASVNWRSGAGFEASDAHPVVNVSWNDAMAFCDWLTKHEALAPGDSPGGKYALPTEAQWEYVCRAGSTAPWSSGDDPRSLDEVAWLRDNSEWRIHPVAQKQPNVWGVFDMHGNVRNWCCDWFAADYYANSPLDDPSGPAKGMDRIVRGSSFHAGPAFARCALRYRDPPAHRIGQIGFRIVREIEGLGN